MHIDGAYIGNVDDYYPSWASEEDSLIDEIFTIEGSANSTFEMYVSHWFFEKDYNTEYSEWSDHMFAPVLTVKNIAKDIMVMEKGCTTTNWTHPVDMNVKTHVKDEKGAWVKNTEYKGDFKVTVTCDEDCVCATSDYSLFDNLYEKLLGIELTSLQADTICHLNKQ